MSWRWQYLPCQHFFFEDVTDDVWLHDLGFPILPLAGNAASGALPVVLTVTGQIIGSVPTLLLVMRVKLVAMEAHVH